MPGPIRVHAASAFVEKSAIAVFLGPQDGAARLGVTRDEFGGGTDRDNAANRRIS